MQTKKCTQCNRTKPVEDFPLEYAKNTKGEKRQKRRASCRECTNWAQTQRKYKRREKDKESSVAAKPQENVAQPRRDSLFDRPVYQPTPWGR